MPPRRLRPRTRPVTAADKAISSPVPGQRGTPSVHQIPAVIDQASQQKLGQRYLLARHGQVVATGSRRVSGWSPYR